MSDLRPILVGEDNPYGSDPSYALFPAPERSAGGRLCLLILGLRRSEYLHRFERANLCRARWSMPEARAKAAEIAGQAAGRTVVLLGARVCRAFAVDFEPFAVLNPGGLSRFVILPHPSGRCRIWNERILGPAVTTCISETAVFLDPPYPEEGRAICYSHDADGVWWRAYQWAIDNGDDPKLRIALCGYEHPDAVFPPGWEVVAWKASGGYGRTARGKANAKRERVWFSPHCLKPEQGLLDFRGGE